MAAEGKLELDCKARVAFELMHQIAAQEKDQARTRDYYLTLYRQCWKATNGDWLENVLKQE